MQLADLVKEYWRPLAEALAGCFFLALTWAARRTSRWLLEHSERERLANEELVARLRAGEMQRHNATLKIALQASANATPPTLESLLGNETRDFSLESSPERFVPPTPMSRASPSGGTPIKRPAPLTPASMRLDWADDDLPTTQPETPATLRRQSDPPGT